MNEDRLAVDELPHRARLLQQPVERACRRHRASHRRRLFSGRDFLVVDDLQAALLAEYVERIHEVAAEDAELHVGSCVLRERLGRGEGR